MRMTLVQAQERYIRRVNDCHTGHRRRVSRAAWSELYRWAEKHGMDGPAVCRDAKDMAELERNSTD